MAALRNDRGWVRGFVDTVGNIHALNRGGWSLCGRRRRKSWYENASGFIPGASVGCGECGSCDRALAAAPARPADGESEGGG